MKIGKLIVPSASIEDIDCTLEEFQEMLMRTSPTMPTMSVKRLTVDCENIPRCTDYLNKCEKCNNNRAKSYFEEKK